ncbi:hypothetical protein [Solitalea koreensis]|uniref:Lipoprotein n=1 Tax=Solitalea koreensis TaxID=543615 RepID=A0A521ELS6_9SPHI|nr:hypothetical protein [Solitalea koreensis]SMO84401.1 hypothetical protein SAMN06265350_11633 [Solitalea koreensis]
MKKVFALILTAGVFAVVACGEGKKAETATDSAAVAVDSAATQVDSAAAQVDSAATKVDSLKK